MSSLQFWQCAHYIWEMIADIRGTMEFVRGVRVKPTLSRLTVALARHSGT
jgi:hypothetical protein